MDAAKLDGAHGFKRALRVGVDLSTINTQVIHTLRAVIYKAATKVCRSLWVLGAGQG